MRRFVIDTNVFINRQRDIQLGASKEEVVQNFVALYAPLYKDVELYSTPESVLELKSFFENTTVLEKLLPYVFVQSPSLSQMNISGVLFAELIEETGKRLYRGMRITEEVLRTVIAEKETQKQLNFETYVALLRKKYRSATREGFIDSTVDLGLIFLAKERDATLVTSDNGLLVWARKFGAKECLPELFVHTIQSLCKAK